MSFRKGAGKTQAEKNGGERAEEEGGRHRSCCSINRFTEHNLSWRPLSCRDSVVIAVMGKRILVTLTFLW
ncbi:unnamed protein product [Musa acuminata subsp. burmannicoides]